MSDPLYLQKEFQTANEPKIHPIIRRRTRSSFVFVSSAGMRLAPELLILEFMREVFFKQHYGDTTTKARQLDPEERNEEGINSFSKKQRAILYVHKGRRKQTKNSYDQKYFAPAYPNLAENAWFRKNSERVVNNFLLSGPVVQYIEYNEHGGKDKKQGQEKRRQELIEKIYHALLGGNSCLDNELKGKDILAVTLGPESFSDYKNPKLALKNLKQKTSTAELNSLISIKNDELANRITLDLESICDLEPKIPRMQWLQLLMTFLRFALPMWLLAQMQITRILHNWLLNAVDKKIVPDYDEIRTRLSKRNRKLLHPTLTPTRELFEHIDGYMKCRVELNILLYCLSETRKCEADLINDEIMLNLDGGETGWIGIEELLLLVREAACEFSEMERFDQVAKGQDIQTFLTREGEQFSAWRNPRKGGVGKNIDEFFRVLYRAEKGDESGGFLLTPEGPRGNRGFTVFPGQLLLKTMTFLAAKSKWSGQGVGTGMLVLQDVEDHFAQYGIDFSNAADARPLLMEKLQAMGLLKGSPDAGSSVAVACPY